MMHDCLGKITRPVLLSWLIVGLFVIWTPVFVGPVRAQESTLAERLRLLAHSAKEGLEAAEDNNVTLMRTEYEEIDRFWESFEDEVRQQDSVAYVELEGALHGVRDTLQAEPLDLAAAKLAYDHLLAEATEIAERFDGSGVAEQEAVEATPADLQKNFEAAYTALEQGEAAAAEEQLLAAMRAWPAVEGAIAARSQEAYTTIEIELSQAAAALTAQPANLPEATRAVEQLQATLAPYVTHQNYTVIDAAAIILREGLEALLVLVALLAFLRQSGNSDKRRWIWLGGAAGILASLATAFILQRVFTLASAGQNREVIEGTTSIIAAALLFYVSYWLHSKASLRGWQNYIQTRTTQVLQGGSLAGLALLAFLAVFREGAETTVFYLGMAPAIAFTDLLLGLGIGLAGLVGVAVLILVVGVKLPLRFFFRVAGLLVYYLGFKFIGTGVHALQVAGVLPASPIAPVPAVPWVGIYPTWESLIPQLLLLAAALVVIFYLRTQNQPNQATRPPAAAV
jgi:high-affinity iron transporter